MKALKMNYELSRQFARHQNARVPDRRNSSATIVFEQFFLDGGVTVVEKKKRLKNTGKFSDCF